MSNIILFYSYMAQVYATLSKSWDREIEKEASL